MTRERARAGLAAACVASALLLLARAAYAEPVVVAPEDPPAHLLSASECRTASGTDLRLPRGYFLPDARWDALDAELRRLQDAETRLGAENASLRAQARSSGDGSAILAVAVGVALAAAGFAAGALIF